MGMENKEGERRRGTNGMKRLYREVNKEGERKEGNKRNEETIWECK
jgi:hypothetical protein